MQKKTKLAIVCRDFTIPAGTLLKIQFLDLVMTVTLPDGRQANLSYFRAYERFGSPFTKPPTEETMWKWSDLGIACTVTGKRTEPDGHGPDGSPSWLLALGLI